MAEQEEGVSFSQFGVVNFSPYTKVGAFAEGLSRGKIMATRCTACGHLEFPPRADCPKCGGTGFEWVDISGKGKLVTYTTIHAAPTGFGDRTPYTIGVIDLEEGGRLLSWIQDMEESDIEVGMEFQAYVKSLEPEAEGKPDRFIYLLRRP